MKQLQNHKLSREDCIEMLIGSSKLVFPRDRGMVPDSSFLAFGQLEPCVLTRGDQGGKYAARQIGTLGLCCMHCGGDSAGHGRYFPKASNELRHQCLNDTILRHIEKRCAACPLYIKKVVAELHRRELAKRVEGNKPRRCERRRLFFEQIWVRLHEQQLIYKEKVDTKGAYVEILPVN